MDEEVKVSELAEANIVNNEDFLMLVQNGTNKKVAIETLLANTKEEIDTKVDKEAARQNSVDANDIEKSGFYYLGTGCSNVPESYIKLIVNGATGSASISQIAIAIISGKIYKRVKNTTWGTWREIVQEEAGTWTPTISTLEGASPTVTYTTRRGSYKKQGNLVFISFYLRGSITALSGQNNYATITGLPFTCKELSLGENVLSTGQAYNIITSSGEVQLEPYGSYIRIQIGRGVSAGVLQVTPTSGYFIIAGSGWYEVA